MVTESSTFKIGGFECTALSDGSFVYAPPLFPPPATFLFPSAPKERLESILRENHLQPEQWTAWVSPYICLMISNDKHRVLIDTGADGLSPSTGRLPLSLQAEGVSPSDIDMVILTHGHPDHLGGNTTSEGKLAFPNARFVMWRREWDFWTSPQQAELMLDENTKKLLLPLARKNLLPIQDRLTLLDQEMEILPGIRSISAPGHTPGHMALTISSKNDQLLVVSDAFLHPIHIEYPDWFVAIDAIPQQVIATRRRLLNLVTEKTTVFAFHFPFPGLGHIVWKGEGWKWQPIEKVD